LVFKNKQPQQAAALSGMAQLIGYKHLRAVGPVLIGALYDWQGSWQVCVCNVILMNLYYLECLGLDRPALSQKPNVYVGVVTCGS